MINLDDRPCETLTCSEQRPLELQGWSDGHGPVMGDGNTSGRQAVTMSMQLDWHEWLATLDPEERERAVSLRDTLQQLGCPYPEAAAQSEVGLDFAQLARFLAVRRIWPEHIDRWRSSVQPTSPYPVIRRLLASGADPNDVVQLARLAAFETANGLLYWLTREGADPELDDSMPGWTLMETVDDLPTWRRVGGLHEGFLSFDPSGNEGSDLWT